MTQLDVFDVVQRRLQDPMTGFSVGSFGAIAEFHRRPDEPAEIDGLTAVTERGAIRVEPDQPARALAYETLSGRPGRWSHGVVVCLPTDKARCHKRAVITELGPDRGAIRPRDRDAVLFDMGLAGDNVDFCVRTDDPSLIQVLRDETGRSVLDQSSPAMAAILDANPHRVAIGRLGRAEVYQPIGRDVTPEGPHTHVLPRLLASGRTHSANVPVPEGWMPCVAMYPPSPIATPLGEPKPWDGAAAEDFNALLDAWGDPDVVAEKARLMAAVSGSASPACYEPAPSRSTRAATRVALRQMQHRSPLPAGLDAWLARFDHAPVDDADEG
ncbi:MAG: hypothetical protein AAF563_09485 [Pseudomonadota bacterium]